MSAEEEVNNTQGVTAAIDNNNCLSNEEEGREGPKVYNNPKDKLNFGWFSLPRDAQNTGPNGESRPASVSGGRKLRSSSSRPSSHQGREISQPSPFQNDVAQQQTDWNAGHGQNGAPLPGGSETYLPPPSRQGYAPQQQQQPADCQRFVVSDDPDMANFERSGYQQQQQQMVEQDYSRGDNSNDQIPMREIDAVDWPLSRTAQEMLMRERHPPAEPNFALLDKQRPRSRGASPEVRAIPPTPMPPLHWNGYRGSNRPTYASWREQWHREHAQPHLGYQANHPIGRHSREQPRTMYRDYNNNNNNEDAKTNCRERIATRLRCPVAMAMANENNNNESKYVVKMDSLDIRDNQGSYWSKYWSDDHVTSIRDGFIGYDGSIFRSLKSSKQSKGEHQLQTIAVVKKCSYEAISLPIGENKRFPCTKKEFATTCRRCLKKWASGVDPIIQPSQNGLQKSSQPNVSAKGEDLGSMEGVPRKEVKPVNKKTPFSLNFHSGVDTIKRRIRLWARKIKRGSSRSSYCHFENDL